MGERDALREAELLAADAVGDVIAFWGFRRALGRIWTLLFMADEPLGADTIGDRLQMSAGAVSTALNELQEWTVVRRVWRPGQRKEFFEAETDFWKMISKVVAERERFLVNSVKERLESAEKLLKQATPTPGIKIARERVRQLLAYATMTQGLLDAFIVSRRADFSHFGDLLRLPRRAASRGARSER